MNENFSTKNWIIGIIVAAFVATIVEGFAHESGIFSEDVNPVIHLLRDWVTVLIFILPVAYFVTKVMSGSSSQSQPQQ